MYKPHETRWMDIYFIRKITLDKIHHFTVASVTYQLMHIKKYSCYGTIWFYVMEYSFFFIVRLKITPRPFKINENRILKALL